MESVIILLHLCLPCGCNKFYVCPQEHDKIYEQSQAVDENLQTPVSYLSALCGKVIGDLQVMQQSLSSLLANQMLYLKHLHEALS